MQLDRYIYTQTVDDQKVKQAKQLDSHKVRLLNGQIVLNSGFEMIRQF